MTTTNQTTKRTENGAAITEALGRPACTTTWGDVPMIQKVEPVRTRTGEKVHIGLVQRYAADHVTSRGQKIAAGMIFAVSRTCNHNGQFKGYPAKGASIITCESCIAIAEGRVYGRNAAAPAAAPVAEPAAAPVAEPTYATIADPVRSYRGRPGCGCGCRGTYSDAGTRATTTRTTEAARCIAAGDPVHMTLATVPGDRPLEGCCLAFENDARYLWLYFRTRKDADDFVWVHTAAIRAAAEAAQVAAESEVRSYEAFSPTAAALTKAIAIDNKKVDGPGVTVPLSVIAELDLRNVDRGVWATADGLLTISDDDAESSMRGGWTVTASGEVVDAYWMLGDAILNGVDIYRRALNAPGVGETPSGVPLTTPTGRPIPPPPATGPTITLEPTPETVPTCCVRDCWKPSTTSILIPMSTFDHRLHFCTDHAVTLATLRPAGTCSICGDTRDFHAPDGRGIGDHFWTV